MDDSIDQLKIEVQRQRRENKSAWGIAPGI
jgi:hypothetical protein